MSRVIPSDQGFRPDQFTGAQVDDRLVVKHEFGLVDSSTQLRFELEPRLCRFLHSRLEDDNSVATPAPGDRPRSLGPPQQTARVGFGRRNRRDAHAGEKVGRATGQIHRQAQGVEEAIGRDQPILWRRVAVEQDPELVPAQPATGIGSTDRSFQPAGDLLEHLIAHRVPETLIHVLEVVQAQREDGRVPPGTAGACECLPHPVAEQGAVRQVGQKVVQGNLRELPLERLALADVARGQYDLTNGRVVQEVDRDRFHLAPGAGGIPQTPLDRLSH